MSRSTNASRRHFVRLLLAAPFGAAVASRLSWAEAFAAAARAAAGATAAPDSAARSLALTPECGDDDHPTPAETPGPFFTPHSPLRTSLLEFGMPGTRIVLAGTVFASDCRPVPGALLDFWQADDSGNYDNAGFRLRGHQFADANGRYRLETIVPGLYPGRTRHFHVRVQAPKGRVLTTQLYLPGEPRNDRDFLHRRDLEMKLKDGDGGRQGRFHFKLADA